MASISPNATREEIEEELDFIDAMIMSLEVSCDEDSARLAELQEKKSELEARLDAWIDSDTDSPSPSDIESFGYRDGPGPDGTPFESPRQDGTPATSAFINGASVGMKRPAPDAVRLISSHPSKRPTPEPSNAPTPKSSLESLNTLDSSSAYRNESMHRRQLAAEAALRRQRESHMADEQLARKMSQSFASASATPTAAASTSQRPAFQTTFNYDGSFRHPPPPVPESKPSTSSDPYGLPQSHQSTNRQFHSPYGKPDASHSQPSLFKAEPSSSKQPLPAQHRFINDVVDLTASDSEEDEDITEIGSSRFTPNNRQPRPRAFPPSAMPFGNPLAVRAAPSQYPGLYVPGSYPGSYPGGPPPGHQPVYGNGYSNPYGNIANNGRANPYGNVQMNGNGMNGQHAPTGLVPRAMNAARSTASDLTGIFSALGSAITGSNGLDDYSAPYRPRAYDGELDLYHRRYNEIADHNPEKTREEINALLDNIRPDEEIPAHLRVQTPEEMSIKLHKYQELGATWLKNCEEGSNKGGILADEMGLGKTIQMLALIVTRKPEDQRCKTTLIIAPVALMRQWKQEIEQKIKPGRYQLQVFVQHGPSKKKSFQDLRRYDIVLSTYGTLAAEGKRLEQFLLRQKQDPNARPSTKEQCALLGDDANWYRVILDEAQCIKNRTTRTAIAAAALNAKYRFCMTGTPMMNNVGEFYSLIKFLRINPYCRWDKFRVDIHAPLGKTNDTEDRSWQAAMSKLQTLCKAVMMRRTKKSTFEGQPILVLPEVTTDVEKPEFDQDEWDFYRHLENQTKLQFNKYVREGEVGRHYSAILVLLLRLRQAACHPHLIKDFSIATAADITEKEVLQFAEQLDPAVVARIKAAGGNFECPVCYDVVENPAIFIPCGHDACRECFSRIIDPSNAIRDGNEGGTGDAKCPNCRAPINGKRVTDFEAFKKVHMPELLTDAEKRELEGDNADDDDDGDESSDGDSEDVDDDRKDKVTKRGNLYGFVVDSDEEKEIDDAEEDEGEDEHEPTTVKKEREDGPSTEQKKGKGKDKKGKGKAERKEKTKGKKLVTLADLAKLSQRNMKARKKYLRRLRETYVDSAKIRKTMELLQTIMNDAEGEKVLVFSQWTSLLDLLEIPIDGQGWGYRRYDGSMNAKMRADAVDEFRDQNKNVRIMLVSLKAGNAGLNLTAASQVIILDPFWNPYIEAQAVDRAHRIGQERTVKVHRMLIEGTIEDRIVEIQETKRELISAALDEKASQNIGRLGVQELAYLFGVTANRNERVQYHDRSRR